MATHVLKSWPQFFWPIYEGSRTHELRRNDRLFSVGDTLTLREYDADNQEYTGHQVDVKVTSITSADIPCAASRGALHSDFCILSIRRPE